LRSEGRKDAALAEMHEAGRCRTRPRSRRPPGQIAGAGALCRDAAQAKKLPEALAAFEARQAGATRFRGVYGAAKTAKLMNDPRAAKYFAELREITAKADTPGRPELAEARSSSAR
jgi:hypothetical protein